MSKTQEDILEDFRFIAPSDSANTTDTADTTDTAHPSDSATGDRRGRIRALESTTDSLYVVSDYVWSGFGMKFDRFIIKGVDKLTAIKTFSQ